MVSCDWPNDNQLVYMCISICKNLVRTFVKFWHSSIKSNLINNQTNTYTINGRLLRKYTLIPMISLLVCCTTVETIWWWRQLVDFKDILNIHHSLSHSVSSSQTNQVISSLNLTWSEQDWISSRLSNSEINWMIPNTKWEVVNQHCHVPT